MQRFMCTCLRYYINYMLFLFFILSRFFLWQVWVWFEWGEHHRARPLLGRCGHQLTHAGLVTHFFLCVWNQIPICQKWLDVQTKIIITASVSLSLWENCTSISYARTDVAVDREVEGDLILGDMGYGIPFKPGTFDGIIR